MPPSEPLSPDEIKQRQAAFSEDDDLDDAQEPLTADEIEQRRVAGWGDEDQPVEDDEV